MVIPELNGRYLYDFKSRRFITLVYRDKALGVLRVKYTRELHNALRYYQLGTARRAAASINGRVPGADVGVVTHLMAWTLNEMHKRDDLRRLAEERERLFAAVER